MHAALSVMAMVAETVGTEGARPRAAVIALLIGLGLLVRYRRRPR